MRQRAIFIVVDADSLTPNLILACHTEMREILSRGE